MLLLIFHPLLQSVAILLAFHAALLGLPRTLSLHFGKRTRFARMRHAIVGAIALTTLLLGIGEGLIVVSRFFHKPILAGIHGQAAIVALPFLLFGLISGLSLYRQPQAQTLLSSLHAINNLLVLLFTLFQIYTGIKLFFHYLSIG